MPLMPGRLMSRISEVDEALAALDDLRGPLGGGRLDDVVAVAAEDQVEGAADVALVVDDQDGRRRGRRFVAGGGHRPECTRARGAARRLGYSGFAATSTALAGRKRCSKRRASTRSTQSWKSPMM